MRHKQLQQAPKGACDRLLARNSPHRAARSAIGRKTRSLNTIKHNTKVLRISARPGFDLVKGYADCSDLTARAPYFIDMQYEVT